MADRPVDRWRTRLGGMVGILVALALQVRALPAAVADWNLANYGARPVYRAAGDGLELSSDAPSDAAIAQDVAVEPGEIYRFSALVRTRDLRPEGAPVYGTIVAQQVGGGNLAVGHNHAGTTAWSEEAVTFVAPISGKAHLALFLCGWGKGTGSAEFRRMRLERIQVEGAPMRIMREPLGPGRINPMQYGQFIEYLCDLVPSMWAEKLYDTSFEGLTPYKFVYLKETDFKEKPWYPYGQPNRLKVTRDASTKVSGPTSLRLDISAGGPAEAGIAQDGISLNRGITCRFSIWARGAGRLVVRLFHGPKTYASASLPVGAEWGKVSAELKPPVTDPDAKLAITFKGPGTVWLDSASLMPADNAGGWRKDVVSALTELRPGVIRVGGSVMDDANLGSFEWKDTIGDPDRRPPFPAWGGQQVPGAGLEEVVQLIQRVGAEPLICVRYEKKTPVDAAEEVEYFNGAVTTPMGALRARNGHPKPYGIKYWQVGNERWGPEYWRAVPGFCRAMRAADPSIKLLSSFPSEEYVKIAGADLDFMCPHQYSVEDLTGSRDELESVRSMISRFGGGRALKLAVTEWNTTAGDAGPARAKLWTLKNALDCARYQNLLHREADLVEIANRSNLTNSFCSGIIQTSRSALYLTPTYYAQQLYARFGGVVPLRIVSPVPSDLSPDVSATLSADGRWLTLFCVNEGLRPVRRVLDLSAFSVSGPAGVWTLTDPLLEADASNSFEAPLRIAPSRGSAQVSGSAATFSFPALSLTVLRIPVGR